jgi:hypothetical protein
MSTDLAIPAGADLAAEMDYARAVAPAALLPAAYRGKQADVLIAIGLGRAIGIAPAQALYEIYVVNGRPSPSANLMAALVRRAGHKLRVEGDATRCTATLIRADDPGHPFTATWTIDQARAAQLAGKDTWKQYPAAMLRARAITEVVRMGASEAVLGMEYSAEEMRDVEPDAAPTAPVKSGLAGVRAAVTPEVEVSTFNVTDAEVVPDEPLRTDAQSRALHARFRDLGLDRDAALEYCAGIIGRNLDSTKELTRAEASMILDVPDPDVPVEDPPEEGS